MTDLKPCPFCGGEAELRDDGETDFPFIVQCVECGGMTCGHRHADTPFGAIAAWNARADYHGYEQAAIEAWESIKAWNARAERTCELVADLEEDGRKRTGLRLVGIHCSECGEQHSGEICFRKDGSHVIYREERDVYCCHCGARITNEQKVVGE